MTATTKTTGWMTCDASGLADECPTHAAPVVNEYDFGRFRAATLYKYRCGCCAVVENDVMAETGQLYDRSGGDAYSVASGRARYVAAVHAAKYQ